MSRLTWLLLKVCCRDDKHWLHWYTESPLLMQSDNRTIGWQPSSYHAVTKKRIDVNRTWMKNTTSPGLGVDSKLDKRVLQRCIAAETVLFKLNKLQTRGRGSRERLQDLTKLRNGTVTKVLVMSTHGFGRSQWSGNGKTAPGPPFLTTA